MKYLILILLAITMMSCMDKKTREAYVAKLKKDQFVTTPSKEVTKLELRLDSNEKLVDIEFYSNGTNGEHRVVVTQDTITGKYYIY